MANSHSSCMYNADSTLALQWRSFRENPTNFSPCKLCHFKLTTSKFKHGQTNRKTNPTNVPSLCMRAEGNDEGMTVPKIRKCSIYAVSLIFGTFIPASFNSLMKMF